jgi:hypothetical protein
LEPVLPHQSASAPSQQQQQQPLIGSEVTESGTSASTMTPSEKLIALADPRRAVTFRCLFRVQIASQLFVAFVVMLLPILNQLGTHSSDTDQGENEHGALSSLGLIAICAALSVLSVGVNLVNALHCLCLSECILWI